MPTQLKKKAIDILPHFHHVKKGDCYIEVALRMWDNRGKYIFLCLDNHTSYKALPDEEVEVEEYKLEEFNSYYQKNINRILEKDKLKMRRRDDLRKVKIFVEFDRIGFLGSCIGCPGNIPNPIEAAVNYSNKCSVYQRKLTGSERPEWCKMEEVLENNPFEG